MKILFVLEHYYPYIGGAETLFRHLAEALVKQGYAVTVVTSRFKPELKAVETINGVELIRVNCRNRFLFSFLSLPMVIRAGRSADIIHTTTYNAALPAWIGAKILGKKVIVTFHEVWGKLWFNLPYISKIAATAFYAFERLLLALPFDHYIAVSKFTQSELIKHRIPASRIAHIYNGLDYADFEGYIHQPPPQFTYTYFGRLGISKGLDLLLPAAARMAKQYPDSRLRLIIPKQPLGMYRKINDQITQLELKDHVELLHELSWPELLETVCQSSCVVIPSYSEGFCFVAVETNALGVPIISSGLGALSETVTGHYIEMETQTTIAFFQALERARKEDFDRRPTVRFSLEQAVGAYVRLYNENV